MSNPKFLHLTKAVVYLVATVVFLSTSLTYASTTINQGSFSTSFSPELIYRRAYIDLRKDAIYFKDDYRNFADQLYLSFKFSKSFKYINEVVFDPVIRTPKLNPTNDLELVVAQAYAHFFTTKNIFFSVGKKLEFDGSGFLINPSDLLNQDKDIYDPLKQREGKFFTRIGFQSDLITSSISFIPKRDSSVEDFSILSKNYFELFGMDTSVQYMFNRTEKSTFGLSMNKFWNDFIETHVDGRYQTRQKRPDTSYSVQEPERDFTDKALSDSSVYVVGGLRLVLSSKRSLVLETIYKESGLDEEQTVNFLEDEKRRKRIAKASVNPPTTIIGRNYVFLAYNDEDTIKKMKFTTSWLYNILDKSSFINIDIDYKVSPIVSMGLSPMFNIGSKNTEFGESYLKNVCYLTLKATF